MAFQGVHGAFSEEAARSFFDDEVAYVPCAEFAAVAAAVHHDVAEFGIFPIANSIAGPVVAALDVLAAGGLATVGAVVHPIHLYLLGPQGASLAGVRHVISHPVALAQCTKFLLNELPHAAAREFFDTAGAAEEVARCGDVTCAAIASRAAADRYDLRVLAGNVHDHPDNHTRFIVVRKTP